MNLTITFIRHAPTLANNKGIYMGNQDIPCDYHELRKHKPNFFEIDKNSLYCSPLIRAIKSAEFLFPNIPLIIDNRLIEKKLGDWEGQLKDSLKHKYPEAYLKSGYLNPLFIPPNGESFEEIKGRSISFLREIININANNNFEKRIFVVTHNGVIRTMRCIIEQMDPMNFFITSEPHLFPIDFTFDITEWAKIMSRKIS